MGKEEMKKEDVIQEEMEKEDSQQEEDITEGEKEEQEENQETQDQEQTQGQKEEETSQSQANDKEKEDLIGKLARLQADFDNYKKRTVKEKEDIYKYALNDFIEKLLPVIDNMERAMQSIEEVEVTDGYVEGVKMVLNQLDTVLKDEGLEEIESDNVEFNPEYHHGVAVEDVENVEDNYIIEVFQKGYKFKDKVIRPAMVKICKK